MLFPRIVLGRLVCYFKSFPSAPFPTWKDSYKLYKSKVSEELLHPGLADSLSAECGVEKKTRKPQNPNPKANP